MNQLALKPVFPPNHLSHQSSAFRVENALTITAIHKNMLNSKLSPRRNYKTSENDLICSKTRASWQHRYNMIRHGYIYIYIYE